MEQSEKHIIKNDELNNSLKLEGALLKLNRLSHFLDHEKLCRHDIFKKSIIINFHSYFLDNSYYLDGLLARLNKKVDLLNEIEYKIDDPSTKSYVNKIWEDIFILLDLFEEHISKVVKRFENGINTDFKIDIEDYQKTNILREVEKIDKPIEISNSSLNIPTDNSWFYKSDFTHDRE